MELGPMEPMRPCQCPFVRKPGQEAFGEPWPEQPMAPVSEAGNRRVRNTTKTIGAKSDETDGANEAAGADDRWSR